MPLLKNYCGIFRKISLFMREGTLHHQEQLETKWVTHKCFSVRKIGPKITAWSGKFLKYSFALLIARV